MPVEDFTLKISTNFDSKNSVEESEKLAESFDRIGKRAASAAAGSENLSGSLGDDLSKAASNSMRSIEGLGGATEATNRLILASVRSINYWAQNLSNFINIGKAAISSIRGIADSFSGLLSGIEEGGKSIGLFENSLKSIQAATGSSSSALDDFNDFLSELSTKSAVSSTSLAGVAARFTALGLSQKEAGEGVLAVLNITRSTGEEIETVASAISDSIRGTARGVNELGINLGNLTKEELQRGEAIGRISELYGNSLVPLERSDQFIDEIRRKWDLIRSSIFKSIASSETVKRIFELISDSLTAVSKNLPNIAEFIDLAFKEAVARAIEFKAELIEARGEAILFANQIATAVSAISTARAIASGNVIGAGIGLGATITAGVATGQASEAASAADEEAKKLRETAGEIRDGTVDIFDELRKKLGLIDENTDKTSENSTSNLDESKKGTDLLGESNKLSMVRENLARESLKSIQDFASENKASIDSLREDLVGGNLNITSPQLELMDDVLASLESGNEVRVQDLESLQALAESIGIADAKNIENASELLGLLGGFRGEIETEMRNLQENFQSQIEIYESQREELIAQRVQDGEFYQKSLQQVDDQLNILKSQEQRDENAIQILENQRSEIQQGFQMATQETDRQIGALDNNFNQLKRESEDIARREIQNVLDVSRRAADQRNQQIVATQNVSRAVARQSAIRQAQARRARSEASKVSDSVKSSGNETKSSVDRSRSENSDNFSAMIQEQRRTTNATAQANRARIQAQNEARQQQQRELKRMREEQAFVAAENERNRAHESAEAEKTRKNAERIARQQRRSQIAIARINASARSAPRPRTSSGSGRTTQSPAEFLSAAGRELANLEKANQQFIQRAVQEQQNRREQQERIDDQNERERARREREFEARQTELMRETRLLEESLIADRNEQQVRAQTAFNPFRDPDAAERAQIPVNIQVQIGDQKLADILTNLQESSLGQVFEVPR